jgi:hypothetical protein
VKLDPLAAFNAASPFTLCVDGVPVAVGAGFDLSDIGARPIRDVHARILAERSP